jgi:hypothetical protein
MTQNVKLTTSNQLLYQNNLIIGFANNINNNISTLNSHITITKDIESALSNTISSEKSRASISKSSLSTAINFTEYNRSINAESSLTGQISREKNRAINSETVLFNLISNETSRAIIIENNLSSHFVNNIMGGIPHSSLDTLDEIANALNDNKDIITTIVNNISNETVRANLSEISLSNKISINVSNDRSTERILSNSIFNITTRAISLETSLSTAINFTEYNRALSTENVLNTAISRESSILIFNTNGIISSESARGTIIKTALSTNVSSLDYKTQSIDNNVIFKAPINIRNTPQIVLGLPNRVTYKSFDALLNISTGGLTSDDYMNIGNFTISNSGVYIINVTAEFNQVDSGMSNWDLELFELSYNNGSRNPISSSFVFSQRGLYDYGTDVNNRYNRCVSMSGTVNINNDNTPIFVNARFRLNGLKAFNISISYLRIA